jgi:hypothetical protein
MMVPQEGEREFLERRYRESFEAAQRASDPALVRAYQGFAEQYKNALARLSIDQGVARGVSPSATTQAD